MRAMAGAAVLLALASVGAMGQTPDWTQAHPAASPPAREAHSMAQLGDKVVLFGGSNVPGQVFGDTWVWDGTNWTQITRFGLFGTGPQPPARFGASMAYDPDTNQ